MMESFDYKLPEKVWVGKYDRENKLNNWTTQGKNKMSFIKTGLLEIVSIIEQSR